MTLFIDDQELLRAFRAGERAALERVYWEYVDAVALVVRRGARLTAHAQISGAPREDWADLVQETFSCAFAERARLAYDGLRPYRQYLLTISRNLLADWMRQRGRELSRELNDEVAAASDEADAADQVSPGELAVVERYLASLDRLTAGVYQQRYVAGVSQKEAGRVLGLSRQRVRTLENRLRRGLRRALRKWNQNGRV